MWTIISAFAGLSFGAVLWWILAQEGASFAISAIASLLTALAVFVFVLLSNPAFRYFRLGALCVGALLINEALKWQVQGTFWGFDFAYGLSSETQGCQAMGFVAPMVLAALSAYLFWIDSKVR